MQLGRQHNMPLNTNLGFLHSGRLLNFLTVCKIGFMVLVDKMLGRNENCNRPKSATRLGLSSKKLCIDHFDGTDIGDNDDNRSPK